MVINKLSGESSEFPDLDPVNKNGRFPVPVHRLDIPVSGCLLLARTPEAAAFLSAAFASHAPSVEKRYWAIIEKSHAANALLPAGELVHWLSIDRKTNKSFAFPLDKSPQAGRSARHKKAILRYKTIGQGKHYLFLEIDLITGRHHQIRAQLAALGLHIKGDLKYGAKRSEKSGGIKLHAFSLAFPNPLMPDETIKVETLPPKTDSLWAAFTEAARHQD
jgi:23S rRNA pseudouridine1911/1915/1917 synthase